MFNVNQKVPFLILVFSAAEGTILGETFMDLCCMFLWL